MTKLEVILRGKIGTTSKNPKEVEIYQLEYDINDVIHSGFNFIRRYQGDYDEDINRRISFSLNQALTITENLIDNGFPIYIDENDATWMVGQEISSFYEPTLPLAIETYIIDKIYPYLKPENQNPIYALDIAISTYFQVFLDFFNEEENISMLFLSKEEVRRRAMINNEQKMLKILDINRKNPEYKITFLGNKKDKNAGVVDFYKYNEYPLKSVK